MRGRQDPLGVDQGAAAEGAHRPQSDVGREAHLPGHLRDCRVHAAHDLGVAAHARHAAGDAH